MGQSASVARTVAVQPPCLNRRTRSSGAKFSGASVSVLTTSIRFKSFASSAARFLFLGAQHAATEVVRKPTNRTCDKTHSSKMKMRRDYKTVIIAFEGCGKPFGVSREAGRSVVGGETAPADNELIGAVAETTSERCIVEMW